jgi:hypothetical protein
MEANSKLPLVIAKDFQLRFAQHAILGNVAIFESYAPREKIGGKDHSRLPHGSLDNLFRGRLSCRLFGELPFHAGSPTELGRMSEKSLNKILNNLTEKSRALKDHSKSIPSFDDFSWYISRLLVSGSELILSFWLLAADCPSSQPEIFPFAGVKIPRALDFLIMQSQIWAKNHRGAKLDRDLGLPEKWKVQTLYQQVDLDQTPHLIVLDEAYQHCTKFIDSGYLGHYDEGSKFEIIEPVLTQLQIIDK